MFMLTDSIFSDYLTQSNMGNIVGVGSPIIDHILHVDDRFMDTIPGKRGGMVPIDYEFFEEILEKAAEANFFPISMPGGSGANVIKSLALLGYKCGLVGVIGKDRWAQQYLSFIKNLGITPLFQTSDLPTAQVISLVTPDGQRTCRSFLGATQDIHPEYILMETFRDVRWVHIEGYSLLQKTLPETVMEFAKKVGAGVSFDLASFEMVNQFKKRILELIPKYVNLLFANEKEASTLVEKKGNEAHLELQRITEMAVITHGKKGCWVLQKEGIIHEPAAKVPVVDTTGAGDLFAAGFLGAYLANRPVSECARLGNLLGSSIVQVSGTELPAATWKTLRAELSNS